MPKPTTDESCLREKTIWKDVKGRTLLIHRYWYQAHTSGFEIFVVNDQTMMSQPYDSVVAMVRAGKMKYVRHCSDKPDPATVLHDLAFMESARLAWSLKTFTRSTPISSLRKLESELEEIEANIDAGKKDPEEFVDALMCLLDIAGREGIAVQQILAGYLAKLEVNKTRRWALNPDNSYSHIKDL